VSIKDHVPGHLNPRKYTFTTPLDRYIPPRNVDIGELIAYDTASGGMGYMMESHNIIDPDRNYYYLDFGDHQVLTYVAGGGHNYVILHKISAACTMGPGKMYHVKLKFNQEGS